MTISIPDFSRAAVVVVGDVMLDRYLFGGTSRISPEAPVPVVHVRHSEDRPGGAANVAVNLARLGVRTTLLGIVGDDDEGSALAHVLRGSGVDCQFTKVPGWPTITKTRVQSRGQQLVRLDREEATISGSDTLAQELAHHLKAANAVVLSDYGKGGLDDVATMISLCKKAGIPVFVDPKGADFEKYRGATLMTPNQGEFEAVAGSCSTDAQLVDKSRDMLEQSRSGCDFSSPEAKKACC